MRHLAILTRHTLELVGRPFAIYRPTGILPSSDLLIRVALIPKPGKTDLGPIGIMPALYRVCAATMNPVAHDWESITIRTRKYFAAGAQRSATDAVWRQSATAQLALALATRTGTAPDQICGAALLYDLQRFFDGIPRVVLLQHARSMVYPMACLRVALACHYSPRVLALGS